MNAILRRIVIASRLHASTIITDLAGGVRALRGLNQLKTGIELLWHMAVRGGVRVETPAGANPMIGTTVQLDGDFITVLHRDAESWKKSDQLALKHDHF